MDHVESRESRTGIETTLGHLLTAEPALKTLCALPLPAKAAYHVKKLAQLVSTETQHFHAERDRLIREFGTASIEQPDEVTIAPTSEHWPTFLARLNDWAMVSVSIAMAPLSMDQLGDHPVTANDLLALGPLLAEPSA